MKFPLSLHAIVVVLHMESHRVLVDPIVVVTFAFQIAWKLVHPQFLANCSMMELAAKVWD